MEEDFRDVLRWLRGLDISYHAAATGYYMVLSVFPALLLILAVLGLAGIPVDLFLGMLAGFLPETVMGAAEELVFSAWFHASGTMAGVAAATALWSASRGMHSLLLGLDAVYDVEEKRGYLRTRLISVGYTFVFQFVLLLTLGLHVFGNTVIDFLQSIDHPVVIAIVDVLDLRFFFLMILQSLLFTLLYMVLPDRRSSFGESLPGGLLASIGWLVFSNFYSVYVAHFPSYANIYGSVYAIAVSMLWLYFCLSILFWGGALNQFIRRNG